MSRLPIIAVLAALIPLVCPAAELQLYFPMLQRVLAEQIFTAEGKLWVRGNAANKCNFAYLERPLISADNGRLLVKARFTGKAATNLFGRCVGFGDSFDVSILALPQYRNGFLALQDVRVDSPGRDTFYTRRVRMAMADSLSKQFKYDVAAEAKRTLEEAKPNTPVRQELRRFDVKEIRVLPDSVLVVVDFLLAIK